MTPTPASARPRPRSWLAGQLLQEQLSRRSTGLRTKDVPRRGRRDRETERRAESHLGAVPIMQCELAAAGAYGLQGSSEVS